MCGPDKRQLRSDTSQRRGPAHPPAQRTPFAPAPASPTAPTRRRSVAFSTVTVRNYALTLGTINPYSTLSSSSIATRSIGSPLTLSWEYQELDEQTLANYEEERGYTSLTARGEEGGDRPRKSTRQMKLSAGRRRAILELRNDVTRDMIDEDERAARKCEERRRKYLSWRRGEGAGAGEGSHSVGVPRRSTELPIRHRPSYPPMDYSSAAEPPSSPRKANDACIALLRQQALASVAAQAARMRHLQLPSSEGGRRAGDAVPQTKAAKKRVVSSRAA